MGRMCGATGHAYLLHQTGRTATSDPKSKIELTNANSVFMEISLSDYCGAIETPEICTMPTSATVIDFTLHRKRRQARAAAELMWTMYAARAGLAVFAVQTTASSDTRRA